MLKIEYTIMMMMMSLSDDSVWIYTESSVFMDYCAVCLKYFNYL